MAFGSPLTQLDPSLLELGLKLRLLTLSPVGHISVDRTWLAFGVDALSQLTEGEGLKAYELLMAVVTALSPGEQSCRTSAATAGANSQPERAQAGTRVSVSDDSCHELIQEARSHDGVDNASDFFDAFSALELDRCVATLLKTNGGTRWCVRREGPWCFLKPPDLADREQGWKIHVSATPLSAVVVLVQCSRVLIRAGCLHKFAATIGHVEALNGARTDRSASGKFLTAYPPDDSTCQALIEELHEATRGLPGPQILSDRRYRPGSLVHYRFGGFSAIRTLTVDGTYDSRLRDPEGRLVADSRKAWFAPPPWVKPLFDGPEPTLTTPPSSVILQDRFVVRAAVRHANRGGVYRAKDKIAETDVIVKQARPYTSALLTGGDSRDALRHEAKMLEALQGLGPEPIAMFEQGGDLFLVESYISGQSFREWVIERLLLGSGDVAAIDMQTVLEVAVKLVDLMAALHGRDLVCRDFNPNNLIVTPQQELRLVDLELVVQSQAWVSQAYTPGYAAPEQMDAARFGPAPGKEADLFALGTTLFYLATGTDPVFLADSPERRTLADRIALMISSDAGHNVVLARLAPALRGLTQESPTQRWSLDKVREFLLNPTIEAKVPEHCDVHIRRLLDDGIEHLIATMADSSDDRLWASGPFGSNTDECNVQNGASGVLGVLVRASQIQLRPKLTSVIQQTACWIANRMKQRTSHLPGLYFGSAGAAWALFEAATYLRDPEMQDAAIEIALSVPTSWPNPDICHGVAGAGMALLHLWRSTDEPKLLSRLHECVDHLTRTADESIDNYIRWVIPQDFDSKLAGMAHFGFAHGIAGIAAFLLAASRELGRDDGLRMARIAGDTLITAADCSQLGATWPASAETASSRTQHYYYWCSGSSGVGTFLIRLWLATGDERYRHLAEAAAIAVRRTRWIASTVACHGLAGNGEFLLDLAWAVGGPYREWAFDLARCIYARHAVIDGRFVLPDESGVSVVADFNTGLSGVLGFLIRLQYGGPRWWMAEPVLETKHMNSTVDPV